MKVMSHQEWQLTRRRLLEDEQRERQSDLSASRAPIQAAVTERAVREIWEAQVSQAPRFMPIGDGFAVDVSNLQSLCPICGLPFQYWPERQVVVRGEDGEYTHKECAEKRGK